MQKLKNTIVPFEGKKIAIICDWIKDWGGAEQVLANLIEIFPNADIFTSVFFQKNNPIFSEKKITTSFIQKIPILNKSHKLALNLRPLAFESFDLSSYDIVISSSSAESKGVITKPETLHIVYCHTPTRYFWSHYHEYLNMMEFGGILNFIGKKIAPKIIHKLRQWDFLAAQRADYFLANSKNTQNRISKYYDRKSKVIYPPVNISEFKLEENKSEFYLYVGRCIPYKKFDLIVEAFNKNGKRLILVTNTNNKLYKNLKAKSKQNITWKLNISRKETTKLFEKTKAFLFPVEEDFGIAPLEAQASGTPVIALKKGGVLETVIDKKTGIFFDNQTSNSLNKAIEKFEKLNFNHKEIRNHALKFDKKIFKENIINFIVEKLEKQKQTL